MPRKVLQRDEIRADRQQQGDADVIRRVPLIHQEGKATQHDENCAVFQSNGNKACNCPASKK